MQRYLLRLALVLVVGVAASSSGDEPLVIDHNTTVDSSINDPVQIVPGANPPTIVTVVPGGYLSPVEVFGNSVLNISGGHCHGSAHDASQINLLLGEMEIETDGTSTVSFQGGYSEVSSASGHSAWQISGGSLEFLHAFESGTVSVSGGNLGMLIGHDTSAMLVSGGNIAAILSGDPDGSGFPDPDFNVITLSGSGFNYPNGPIPVASGQITGVLANGDPINASFEIHGQASIVLVPEPSTLVLLGTASMAAIFSRRRKRRG